MFTTMSIELSSSSHACNNLCSTMTIPALNANDQLQCHLTHAMCSVGNIVCLTDLTFYVLTFLSIR